MSAGASFGAAQGLGALNINGGALYHLGTSMAGNLANAATRSVLTKSNFGDNIIAAIPDTIAQTIGGVIGDGVEKAAAERSKKDLEERLKSEAGRVLSTLQAGVYNPGNLYAFAVIPRMPNEPLVMTDVLPRSMYKTGKTMTVKGSDGKNHTLGIEIPQNKKDIDLLSREAKKVRDPKVRAFIESQLGKWEAEIKSSEGRLSDTEVEDRIDSKYWKRKPQVRTKKPSNQSPAVQEKAELRTNEDLEPVNPKHPYKAPKALRDWPTLTGIYEDVANLPSGVSTTYKRHGIGETLRYYLGGLPPTLGGGAVSSLSGASQAASYSRLALTVKVPKGLPLLRQQYIEAVEGLRGKVAGMQDAGKSAEEIARAVHADRRAIGVQFKDLTPEVKRFEIYERNLRTYGDKLGPTIEWLREGGKSWEQIIESATRTGGKDVKF